jgi:hypothetical protein
MDTSAFVQALVELARQFEGARQRYLSEPDPRPTVQRESLEALTAQFQGALRDLRARFARHVDDERQKVASVAAKDRVPSVEPLTIAATTSLLDSLPPGAVLALARNREEIVAASELGRVRIIRTAPSERDRIRLLAEFERAVDLAERPVIDSVQREARERHDALGGEIDAFTVLALKVETTITTGGHVDGRDLIRAGLAVGATGR